MRVHLGFFFEYTLNAKRECTLDSAPTVDVIGCLSLARPYKSFSDADIILMMMAHVAGGIGGLCLRCYLVSISFRDISVQCPVLLTQLVRSLLLFPPPRLKVDYSWLEVPILQLDGTSLQRSLDVSSTPLALSAQTAKLPCEAVNTDLHGGLAFGKMLVTLTFSACLFNQQIMWSLSFLRTMVLREG